MNNRTNRIFINGLRLYYNDNMEGVSNKSVSITQGEIIVDTYFDGENISTWKPGYFYKNFKDISLNCVYDTSSEYICLIYAQPDYKNVYNNIVPIIFYIDYLSIGDLVNYNSPNDNIFIGMCYIDNNYIHSQISFSLRNISNLNRFNISFNEWKSLNEYQITKYINNIFYFENEIVFHNNKLYICKKNHNSFNFNEELDIKWWICISATGGTFDFDIYDYDIVNIFGVDYLCTYLKILSQEQDYIKRMICSQKINI